MSNTTCSLCAVVALASCTDLPNVDDPRDLGREEAADSCSQRLTNGDFDKGLVGWEATTTDLIIDERELHSDHPYYAHSGDYFAWFGGSLALTRRLNQRVSATPGASALQLKGKYFVATDEPGSRVDDTFSIEVAETATGKVLATSMMLSNVTPTGTGTMFSWKDFTVVIAAEHAKQGFVLRLTSITDSGENTNFIVDTLSLKPMTCQ